MSEVLTVVLGIAALIAGFWGIWRYGYDRGRYDEYCKDHHKEYMDAHYLGMKAGQKMAEFDNEQLEFTAAQYDELQALRSALYGLH